METMKDLVGQLYQKYDLRSEAELARLLSISPQAMNEYNSGRSKYFSDRVIYTIAEKLNRDPAEVLLIREYQRSKDPRVKIVWREIIEKVSKTAAVVFVGAIIVLNTPPSQSMAYFNDLGMYIMSKVRIYFHRLLARCEIPTNAC